MEKNKDKLITLAILTYSKAQTLQSVLENEDIEAFIHNVNQIQPVISSGVRVRIKESDLPRALEIVESSTWLAEDVIEDKDPVLDTKVDKVLIPIDFSDYSVKACEIGFSFAAALNAEVVLLHVYYTPMYAAIFPYSDFNYQTNDEVIAAKNIVGKARKEVNRLSDQIKEQIENKKLPNIPFSCILREGIPEEEILRYAKEQRIQIVIMGTRGKNQKDIDLIGSVTAEVIDRSRAAVLALPEETPFRSIEEVKNVAFITNFDQRDLIAFDSLIKNTIKPLDVKISLLHLADEKDTWDEIKLGGIKEYFKKQYPSIDLKYDIIKNDDLLENLEEYIKQNKIDMITLASYKRNIFSRLFNPSIARKMIFHADTPMLVIHTKK